MLWVGQPVGAVGDEAPGAHLRDAVRQGVDVAVVAVEGVHVAREPLGRYGAVAHEEAVELADEVGVARGRDLAVVRNLAHLPQPLDGGGAAARLPCRAAREAKSRSALRHCSTRKGSKWCPSSASTSSGSNGGQRPD